MLKEGDAAPDFALETDEGAIVRTGDFRGQFVVIYFYPKDNTPGCTREAQAFSAAKKKFDKAGVRVIGISKDSTKSHGSFRQKCALTITLASDASLEVHKAFGAYGEKTMYGKKVLGTIRSTFIVGPDGTVAKVFPRVTVDGHADAVLDAVKQLAKG